MKKSNVFSVRVLALLLAVSAAFLNTAGAQSLELSVPAGLANQVPQTLPQTHDQLLDVNLVNGYSDAVQIQSIQIIPLVDVTGPVIFSDLPLLANGISNIQIFAGGYFTQQPSLVLGSSTLFETLYANNYFTMSPGQVIPISIFADLAAGIDTLQNLPGIHFEVVVLGIDTVTHQSVSMSGGGVSTYLTQCLTATENKTVSNYLLQSVPAVNVPIGTFTVRNTSPGSVTVTGCQAQVQGSVSGVLPTLDYLQMSDATTGQNLGSQSLSSPSGFLYVNFQNAISLAPGDSAVVECFTNVQSMSAGDVISLGATFQGTFAPYTPYGNNSDGVQTQPTVGQQILFTAPSGIQSVNNDKPKVIADGNHCTFLASTNKPWDLEVYAITGQRIMQKNCSSSSETISKGELASGVYIYKCTVADMTYSGKFTLLE